MGYLWIRQDLLGDFEIAGLKAVVSLVLILARGLAKHLKAPEFRLRQKKQ